MVVETKESRYLVRDGKLIDDKGWLDLRDYTSELKFEGREEDEFTINKVFKLVWERKREIE